MTLFQFIVSLIAAIFSVYLAWASNVVLATFVILFAIWIIHLPATLPRI